MKIIFLKDVARVGQRGMIKDVADGYANSLIARGVAEKATPKAIQNIENQNKQNKEIKEKRKEEFKLFLQKIKDINLTIKSKSNEKGVLFKSISKKDILDELKKNIDFSLKEENLEIGNIKNIGDHDISILDGENKGIFKIKITN